MRSKLYIFICIIFLLIIVINSSDSVNGLSINELYENRRREIQNNIDQTVIEMNRKQNEISSVSDEVATLSNKIAIYQQEIRKLNLQALQLQFEINKIQEKLKMAEESYTEQKNLFEKRMVVMYKKGETAFLDVLLNSSSVQDFISKFYYLGEIAKRDQQLISNIQKLQTRIETRKSDLLTQQEELDAVTTNRKRVEITLENSRTIRDSYIGKLSEEEQEIQRKLKQYEEDMTQLEQNILFVSLSSMNEGYVGGDLQWPVPGYEIVTSGYGMRMHPIFHVNRLHTGIDIGVPEGTPVLAANTGVVTLARESTSYGNYVMVDHGGGIVTLYAHGKELIAKVGDVVKAGDVVMLSGNTGWSTGPHLHFEIRYNGNTINPLPFVTRPEDKENDNNEDNKEKKDKNEILNEFLNEIGLNEIVSNEIVSNEIVSSEIVSNEVGVNEVSVSE